jgi:chromosome segregation ATPase
MDRDHENPVKKIELLQRQIHFLTSQVFHMINLQTGYLRRISELEKVVDDKAFLADHAPSEESLDLSMDLSPSIRRRLIQLEQVKAILHRRNALIAEVERQLDLYRGNSRRQEDLIADLRARGEDQGQQIEKLADQVKMLTGVVNRWWNNPFYRILVRIKAILTGGRKK